MVDAGLRSGVIRSRAEVAALLMKAARGAGLPLALAEDLYQTADFITSDDVVRLAKDIADGGQKLLDLTDALDDIACGGSRQADDPLAHALAATRGWVLQNGRKCEGRPEKQVGPIDVPDHILTKLEELAAQTYVPETAASRARGAGAGSIDND